jgi:hypothetical protein
MFRSAAEEVAAAKEKEVSARGHMHAESGRVVQVAPDNLKVVLTHEDGTETERPCTTMREGEAIIRHNTPAAPKSDNSRERDERPS